MSLLQFNSLAEVPDQTFVPAYKAFLECMRVATPKSSVEGAVSILLSTAMLLHSHDRSVPAKAYLAVMMKAIMEAADDMEQAAANEEAAAALAKASGTVQ